MSARAILLASLALASPVAAAASAADRAFVPPTEPVMMIRTLERTLGDGQEVRSIRRYLIRFVAEPAGWRIEGTLQDVSLSVPPALEGFAALERARDERDLFPLLLDKTGQIRGGGGASLDPQLRGRAEQLGEGVLARGLKSADERDRSSAMLAAVIAAGEGGTAWPRDLFNPVSPETLETRKFSAPGGATGTLSLTVRSTGHVAGSLPAAIERTIVSELAGTRRTTREQWSFSRP